jgi:hypothetical protein
MSWNKTALTALACVADMEPVYVDCPWMHKALREPACSKEIA